MPQAATGSAGEPSVGTFDAVSAFDAYLDPPKEQPGGEGEVEQTEEQIAAKMEAEMAAKVEADEAATEEVEAEPEVDGEEEEGEQQQAPATFTVRVDGKEETVSESELIAGYQRQADYTRKTQALSTERKTLQDATASVQQERSEYAQLLPKIRTALAVGMGKEPDWEALRTKDPANAAVEKQRWDERRQKIADIQAEEQRVAQQFAAEQETIKNQILAEQAEKVKVLLPHWKSADVAKREGEEITNLLRETGFGEHELTIYDARALKIAHMASKWLAMQKQKPALQKKIAAAPAVKPGAGHQRPSDTPAARAQKRFAKSGSMKDAPAAFERFIT